MNEAYHRPRKNSEREPRSSSLFRSARTKTVLALTAVSALALAGAQNSKPVAIHRIPGAATVEALQRWLETGKASWYGLKFQGHRTATGEKFDMNDLTCAHRSLPLGSWVRVTNLRNHKSVVVRVNDRGPVSTDRIIDLSYAAANAVGIGGMAKVKLESAPAPRSFPTEDSTWPLIAQLRMPPSLVTFPLPLP